MMGIGCEFIQFSALDLGLDHFGYHAALQLIMEQERLLIKVTVLHNYTTMYDTRDCKVKKQKVMTGSPIRARFR